MNQCALYKLTLKYKVPRGSVADASDAQKHTRVGNGTSGWQYLLFLHTLLRGSVGGPAERNGNLDGNAKHRRTSY